MIILTSASLEFFGPWLERVYAFDSHRKHNHNVYLLCLLLWPNWAWLFPQQTLDSRPVCTNRNQTRCNRCGVSIFFAAATSMISYTLCHPQVDWIIDLKKSPLTWCLHYWQHCLFTNLIIAGIISIGQQRHCHPTLKGQQYKMAIIISHDIPPNKDNFSINSISCERTKHEQPIFIP